MTRPLMQQGIGQLEQMFATMTGDTKVLKRLEHELSYRQVPRAYALAEKVGMALRTGESANPSTQPAAEPKRPRVEGNLLCELAQPVPVVSPSKAPPSASTPPREPHPAPPAEQFSAALDEAYRLLNVSPASAWEEVEQSRRQLVERAHPAAATKLAAERRSQSLMDARRVNAAYALLAETRCKANPVAGGGIIQALR